MRHHITDERAMVEGLEDRRLMSATLAGGEVEPAAIADGTSNTIMWAEKHVGLWDSRTIQARQATVVQDM